MDRLDGAGWLLLSDADKALLRSLDPAIVLAERFGYPYGTCQRAISLLGPTEAADTLRIACEYEVSVAQVEFGLERQEKR